MRMVLLSSLIVTLIVVGCGPITPSVSKNAPANCDGPTNNANSVTNSDNQLDVSKIMGQDADSSVTVNDTSGTHYVDTYNMCRQFVFTFDASGHYVSKDVK